MLVIALVSIIWGTLVAMTQPDARMVVAYSSVAQLGFITLGIFSLSPPGAPGAAHPKPPTPPPGLHPERYSPASAPPAADLIPGGSAQQGAPEPTPEPPQR